MKYQTKKRIYDDHSGVKIASHTISWVRTSFILVLSAFMMAVALHQMASYTGIIPGHNHMSPSRKIFDTDERLRGRDRLRRVKKETHYHLHVHNPSGSANTGATKAKINTSTSASTNTNVDPQLKDEITDIDVIEVHQHSNNETTDASETTTRTEIDALDEIETSVDAATVNEVEFEHEESGDVHESEIKVDHEDAHELELDEAKTKQDNNIFIEESTILEKGQNISVQFINDYHLPVHINWINHATGDEENVISTLRPNESKVLESHPGHTFVAFDDERSIRIIITIPVSTENRDLEDGKVEFRIATAMAMQQEEQRNAPESSHVEGQPASAPKSVAEPDLAHQHEIDTASRSEPEPIPEPVHQDQQRHPPIKANFINEYHESIHINWINPRVDEEKRVLSNIATGESGNLETDQKHTFVAFNDERNFRQVFTVDVSNQDDKAEVFFHVANDEQEERQEGQHDKEPEHEQKAPPKLRTMAKFVNNFSQNVNVSWINPRTGDENTVITNLQPNSDESLETHSGHKFVAYNEDRTLRQVFVMNAKDGFTEIHKIMGSSRLAEL